MPWGGPPNGAVGDAVVVPGARGRLGACAFGGGGSSGPPRGRIALGTEDGHATAPARLKGCPPPPPYRQPIPWEWLRGWPGGALLSSADRPFGNAVLGAGQLNGGWGGNGRPAAKRRRSAPSQTALQSGGGGRHQVLGLHRGIMRYVTVGGGGGGVRVRERPGGCPGTSGPSPHKYEHS